MELYNELTDTQLIGLASSVGVVTPELNEVWYSRFGMSYPYRLIYKGRIINCITLKVINDDECDKLILRQANDLRSKGLRTEQWES